MDTEQPATPEPTSPPMRRPSSQRSRGDTPKGRPGRRRSSSRERSESRQSRPAPHLSSVLKGGRRGRPAKVDRRRKDHDGRDGATSSGARRKRKGKFKDRRVGKEFLVWLNFFLQSNYLNGCFFSSVFGSVEINVIKTNNIQPAKKL